ncbi:S1/P1 nuclease [Croceitalea dokdonensis DOKDO 023]|uniref:S1/P1 nuclease n=1 Tax=Croceitalea dokdonensis DOKDO 023 TaxID=1300341 RepID=A0A0P7AEV6_9FLAO|nr:S1/P1 nuclease [Croceitalea dokdonensis]KPM31767.1 S1/P1 nuclease [Croceitalea dokdonensis DOKDO 023]
MRLAVLFILFMGHFCSANLIWSKTGHRVTGHIAQKHLSRKAERAINDLLDGHSLAFAATYADEIKADRSFSKYSAWHYVNYPMDMGYEDSEKSPYGDVVQGIEFCKKVILDGASSRKDKVFHLKMLIHLIGDMHQPMHAGRAEDRGGNDIQIQWFGEGTNLHRLWDSNMINSYGMTYYELGDELEQSVSKQERKRLQEGTIYEWVDESHTLAAQVYASVSVGEDLRYQYGYQYNDLLFSQLQKAGFRLAKVLNELFS